MYREHEVGLQVRLRPAQAANRINFAIERAGSLTGASRRLKCGLKTLKRWIERLQREGHSIVEARAQQEQRGYRQREPEQAVAPAA